MLVTIALKANYKLGLKISSHDFHPNCVISLFFYLYLMFYACVKDLMGCMKIF